MNHSVYSVLKAMSGKVRVPVMSEFSSLVFTFPDQRDIGGCYFTTKPDALALMTSVSRSQKGHVTGTFVINGEVLPPKNKWVSTPLPRNTFQQRNFVKSNSENPRQLDLVVDNLMVFMTQDHYDDLVGLDIELQETDITVAGLDGYMICLSNYPLYHNVDGPLSVDDFVKSYVELFEAKAHMKALNHLAPKQKEELVPSMITEMLESIGDSEGVAFMESLGLTNSSNFTIKSQYTSSSSSEKSPLKVSLKSLSNLPSKKALDEKKESKKKLNASFEVLDKAFKFFDGLSEKEMQTERKYFERTISNLDDCVLSHMTSNMIYGGAWFEHQERKITRDVTVLGVQTEITIELPES